MPRVRLTVVAVALFVLTTGAALADEVIHFENGTFLPIRSHTVKDTMVHVVLGSNASMAFPTSMVDRIERGGRLVYDPSDTMANRAVEGPETPHVPGTVRLDAAPAMYRAGTSVPATSRRSASARRAAMMASDPAELLRMQQAAEDTGPQSPESDSVFPGAASEKLRRVSEVRSLSSPEGRNASPVLEDARKKVKTKPPRLIAKPFPLEPLPDPPAESQDDAQRAAGDSPDEIAPGGTGESGN
jgi:hypothetical protein